MEEMEESYEALLKKSKILEEEKEVVEWREVKEKEKCIQLWNDLKW